VAQDVRVAHPVLGEPERPVLAHADAVPEAGAADREPRGGVGGDRRGEQAQADCWGYGAG
jgi:hypothetical protein